MSDVTENKAQDLVDSTVEEHRGCMLVVAEVEACLDSPPDREGRWFERLREKLGELSTAMREHFASEESGPLYRRLPVSHPRLAERLARLEAEHAEILRKIDAAMARAARLGNEAEPHQQRELNAQVQLLVAVLERHEAQENELVIEAHWDEVGVGD